MGALLYPLITSHPLHLDSFWLQASGTPLLKTVLWALSICMGLARRAGKLTPFKCNRKERMISRSWKINISVSLPLKWNHSEPSSTFSPKGRQCNSAPPAHSSDLLINTPLIGLLPLSFFHLHCLPLLLGITSEINYSDPWTTQVWTEWVHLKAYVFNSKYTVRSAVGWTCRYGATGMEEPADTRNCAYVGPTIKLYADFGLCRKPVPQLHVI